MRKFFIGILALFIFWNLTNASEFPDFENFVTDTTSTLSSMTIENLNAKLANYEMETGNEVSIVLVDSTDGMPIEMYATDLGNEWGVGKANIDNGAILVVAVDDRELFLAVGNQLEGALTDIEAHGIVDEIIVPFFKNENFDDGILAGVDGIFAAIDSETFTDLRAEISNESLTEISSNLLFVFVFFVLPWLAAILGRSKKIWPGGAIGAVGGGALGLFFAIGLVGTILTAIGLGAFGLFFDFIVSKNYANAKKSGSRIAWWAGGNRGGFGAKQVQGRV